MSLKRTGVIRKAAAKPRGGVAVAHHKNTADMPAERLPAPPTVILPMQQHIGAPCEPVVKVGDTVGLGQLIADSERPVSAPIHASVSGKVTAIGETPLPNGVISPSITIESDGEMRLFEGIAPPKIETKEDFIKAVRDSGLVGLGGAGFPAHIKLNTPPGKEVDTLIVNVAECEPFITVDYRECLDNSWDVLSGICTIREFLGIKNVIIAIEDNKPLAVEELKKLAANSCNAKQNIQVTVLKSRYPQGAEKVIIHAVTGRKVPPGKLPADAGCLVMNVASVAFVARYLKSGKPLTSRSLTVDGSAIAEPKNVRVPIGTDIGYIIEHCGGFKTDPYKLLMGGPMMGLALIGPNIPLLKQNNAILAFSANDRRTKTERPCIRCGRCVKACPMLLTPFAIARFARTDNFEKLEPLGATACMECGCCAYVCPAGIPLVQYMRLAKSMHSEQEAKK